MDFADRVDGAGRPNFISLTDGSWPIEDTERFSRRPVGKVPYFDDLQRCFRALPYRCPEIDLITPYVVGALERQRLHDLGRCGRVIQLAFEFNVANTYEYGSRQV